MFLELWFGRAYNRTKLMKIFQAASTGRLGLFKALVKHIVGVFPWNGDHGDAVLLLDLLRHIAQFFPANLRAADALEPGAIVDHRLNRLQSVARLGLDDPH